MGTQPQELKHYQATVLGLGLGLTISARVLELMEQQQLRAADLIDRLDQAFGHTAEHEDLVHEITNGSTLDLTVYKLTQLAHVLGSPLLEASKDETMFERLRDSLNNRLDTEPDTEHEPTGTSDQEQRRQERKRAHFGHQVDKFIDSLPPALQGLIKRENNKVELVVSPDTPEGEELIERLSKRFPQVGQALRQRIQADRTRDNAAELPSIEGEPRPLFVTSDRYKDYLDGTLDECSCRDCQGALAYLKRAAPGQYGSLAERPSDVGVSPEEVAQVQQEVAQEMQTKSKLVRVEGKAHD